MPREFLFFAVGVACGIGGSVYFWLLWRVGKMRGDAAVALHDARCAGWAELNGRPSDAAGEAYARHCAEHPRPIGLYPISDLNRLNLEAAAARFRAADAAGWRSRLDEGGKP